ncbi:MAG: hypothetical protein AAF847_01945 [Bacteroidota bacterium]
MEAIFTFGSSVSVKQHAVIVFYDGVASTNSATPYFSVLNS